MQSTSVPHHRARSHSRVKPKGPQTDPRPRLARPNPPSPNPPRYLLPNACLPPPPPNNPQPGQIFRPDNSNVSQRGRRATTGRAQRSITKLYAAFEDLVDYDFPMVLVDEWDEITPEALNQWWLVGRSPVRRRRGVATLAESCFSQNFRKLVIYIEKYLTTPHNIAQYSRTFQIPKAKPSTAMSCRDLGATAPARGVWGRRAPPPGVCGRLSAFAQRGQGRFSPLGSP